MAATPEMRLLTLSLPRKNAASSPLPDLTSIRWADLIDLAQWHGVLPLVSSLLLAPGRPSTHLPVAAQLRSSQDLQLVRTLAATAALIELQREFQRSGIRVLPWKGPSVGLLLYGSATLRESADLDFLMLQEDLPHIQEIAARLGYLGHTFVDEKDRYQFEQMHEYTFFRSRDQVMLEFHTTIMTSRFTAWQDSHTYIRRANITLPLGDTELLLQCPEDLLVSLCVHAIKHNWDRLKWSCDIAMFLKLYGETLPWPAYLAELSRTGKQRIVLLGLFIAGSLFELPLPPAVQQALSREPKIAALGAELAQHLMTGSKEPISAQMPYTLEALLCPRLRDRIVYIFSPILRLEYEDLYIRSSNRLLSLLNYPYRFWRLLRRHGLQRLIGMTAVYIRTVR